MISTDPTLLGQGSGGDAIARHLEYAKQVAQLDIFVLSKKRANVRQLSENCTVQPLSYWRMKKAAEKFFRRQPYDLIVCQDPFLTARVGTHLKKKFEKKLIIHFHGDFFDNPFWLQERLRHRYYRRLAERHVRQADSIRVVSDALRPKLEKRYVKREDIYTIPTPVDLEKFRGTPSAERAVKKIVLTVGRIVAAKDFPTLLKTAVLVAARVPQLEWQIIGEGNELAQLRRQTRRRPYLRWLGAVAHEQLKNYYQQAAVFVLTSRNESFGKVFLEAAMAQLPCVATDTLGARTILRNGQTGYLAPIGDAQRLAERIVYLLERPEVAGQMGQAAQQHALQNFGWEKSVYAIIQMWRQTVAHD